MIYIQFETHRRDTGRPRVSRELGPFEKVDIPQQCGIILADGIQIARWNDQERAWNLCSGYARNRTSGSTPWYSCHLYVK